MTKVNINNFDLDDLDDDDFYDELYEDNTNKTPPKFKDEYTKEKKKIKHPKRPKNPGNTQY